jgi:endonuclease G
MRLDWIESGTSPEGFIWNVHQTPLRYDRTRVQAVIGDSNFIHIHLLEQALRAARHVARIRLPGGAATGFLISHDVLLTNHHVLETPEEACQAVIQFNYRLLSNGVPAPVSEYRCDPDSLFHTNPNLDYTMVRLKSQAGDPPGQEWGYFNIHTYPKMLPGQRVNIIQYPGGGFQHIAFRDNFVRDIQQETVQYITDTDYGTSGAPVLDDTFAVLALHNQRVRDPTHPGRWYRNQGYRINAIIKDISDRLPNLPV